MQKCFIMFFILVAMLIVARSVDQQETRDEHNFVAKPGKDAQYSAFGEIDLREDMAMGKYPNTK